MKVNSNKAYELQTATQAMTLWETASRTDKPVSTDTQNNITVVYGLSPNRFSKPSTQRDAARQCLLDKIKAESGPFLGIKNDVFVQVMKSSLPSLERFVNEGKLGNLPAEWRVFQKSQNASLRLPPEIEMKRYAHTEKIAKLVPPDMKIDIQDGSVSFFTHQFSEASQKRLVEQMSLIANEKINRSLALSNQFINDANRYDLYRIQTPKPSLAHDEASLGNDRTSLRQTLTRSPQLNSHGAEVVGKLYDFCEGDLAMMTTLSCFVCQSSIISLNIESESEMAGPSGYRPVFTVNQTTLKATPTKVSKYSIYELDRDANGEVIVGLKYLTKVHKISSPLADEEWPFQAGPDSANAAENNFNERSSIVVAMKPSDLKKGLILPSIRRPPETSYVFDFDWKRIDKN